MWRPVPQPLPTPGAGSCSVAPLGVHAGSNNCVLGQNLGCFVGEQKMWLIAPCQGAFLCDGFQLQCKASRMSERPGRRHNCTCYEYAAALPPEAGGKMLAGLMPQELAKTRLVEGSIRHARFVPNTTEEIMHATFTMWNFLDRVMLESSRSNYQTGYVREVQVRRMVQLVTRPGVRTYCEVRLESEKNAFAS